MMGRELSLKIGSGRSLEVQTLRAVQEPGTQTEKVVASGTDRAGEAPLNTAEGVRLR